MLSLNCLKADSGVSSSISRNLGVCLVDGLSLAVNLKVIKHLVCLQTRTIDAAAHQRTPGSAGYVE